MTLHTYNKSLDAGEARLRNCLRTLASGDSLLLLEDGVYLASQLHADVALRTAIPEGVTLYALTPDVAARGLSAKLPADFSGIDYDAFVQLCLAHPRIVNWN
ncbi:MAG: sulfurtransferase complex subunit TusB [Pseudomonadota bacterium]|nr:sulfurtransferase complex subunit TusB [Pseudomonadota bacterium]